ncbi:hypothetical protein C8035_v004328 [Colletotrichum spinosum]|uniref:Uncharacterized protein n=1 Tax=Colletotrichum spinosum TaxID=1347390 RepID=A0A4R8PUV1_9PEZI|nr:hypothetical protein C8035_v004328 [Colletotrichum spinosum]
MAGADLNDHPGTRVSTRSECLYSSFQTFPLSRPARHLAVSIISDMRSMHDRCAHALVGFALQIAVAPSGSVSLHDKAQHNKFDLNRTFLAATDAPPLQSDQTHTAIEP